MCRRLSPTPPGWELGLKRPSPRPEGLQRPSRRCLCIRGARGLYSHDLCAWWPWVPHVNLGRALHAAATWGPRLHHIALKKFIVLEPLRIATYLPYNIV